MSPAKWRDFTILPSLSLTGLYDTNIFADDIEEEFDRVLIISPGLDIRSQWSRHQLVFGARGSFGRYDRFTSEDYDDFDLDLSGRYDLSDSKNLFGGLAYREGHEERGLTTEDPTEFAQHEAHLGTALAAGKLRLRFGGTYEYLDFDDSSISGGSTLNNDDRDRSLYGTGLRLGYEYNAELQPFVQLVYDRRRYDERLDDNGYARNSDGYRAALGVKAEPWKGFSTEFYLGYLWQDYDDDRFDNLREPTFALKATWLTGPRTIISGQVERSLNETTIEESSGYLRTSYDITISQQVTEKLVFNAHLGLTQDTYNDIHREDDYYSAGFGFRHELTESLYISTDYRYLERDSTEGDEDYERHQLMVSLGASMPGPKSESLAGFSHLLEQPLPTEQRITAPGGFYLGGQLGHGGLTTRTSEVRHSGGSESKFGSVGFSGGLFAGYGYAFGRWLPAFEVALENSDVSWEHYKDKPQSRTMQVSREESLSGSLRLAYLLDNGSLLYGRAGLVSTQFHDEYAINNLPESALTDDRTLLGLRLGLGLEVPLDARWFLRLESLYTDYENDHLVASGFDEDFDHKDTTFNVGLGWRITPHGLPQRVPTPASLAGFYAGARMGYGTVNSEVDALHLDGGPNEPGPYDYYADFGDTDFSAGFFTGYGLIYGTLYLGVELEAEVSPSDWARERDGESGRNFSVDKQVSFGASARIGMALQNGSLVYGRVGVVETTFNTRYMKGSNAANDIDRNDDLTGLRVACGLEVPLTERAFFRLEYSYTDYESYGFVTAHANSDQVDFDNRETLASIAIGFRF